jgi:hypothetical protein
MQEYINLNGNKCLEYIEQDKKMSSREKQQYIIRHKYIQTKIN